MGQHLNIAIISVCIIYFPTIPFKGSIDMYAERERERERERARDIDFVATCQEKKDREQQKQNKKEAEKVKRDEDMRIGPLKGTCFFPVHNGSFCFCWFGFVIGLIGLRLITPPPLDPIDYLHHHTSIYLYH